MDIRHNLVEDFSHLRPLFSNHPFPNGYYISVHNQYYILHILLHTYPLPHAGNKVQGNVTWSEKKVIKVDKSPCNTGGSIKAP